MSSLIYLCSDNILFRGESTSGDSGLFFPVPETRERKPNKPKPIKPGVKIEESADEIDDGH